MTDVTDCCIESQKERERKAWSERGISIDYTIDKKCFHCEEKIVDRWSSDYVDAKHYSQTCRLCGRIAHGVYCASKNHWWRFKAGPTCEDCTARAVDTLYALVDKPDSGK